MNTGALSGVSLALVLALLAACGPSDDGWDPSDPLYTGCYPIGPISDSHDADSFVRWLVFYTARDNVRSGLLNGTYVNSTVAGTLGGSATLSGTVSYMSAIDCGPTCVRSENHTYLHIVFNNFQVMCQNNVRATVNGAMDYADYTWNQQSGMGYTSGGALDAQGTNVSCSFVNTDDQECGFYEDTISFDVSAPKGNMYGMEGWVAGTSGTYDPAAWR